MPVDLTVENVEAWHITSYAYSQECCSFWSMFSGWPAIIKVCVWWVSKMFIETYCQEKITGANRYYTPALGGGGNIALCLDGDLFLFYILKKVESYLPLFGRNKENEGRGKRKANFPAGSPTVNISPFQRERGNENENENPAPCKYLHCDGPFK
ncbi:hypothetical protein OIU76_014200 [Salix suchowensis]|nr:hypothetical protein OIU76_014200 [Salix suchowensis]